MTPGMEGYVDRWLFDPMVGKLVAITIGILIVIALVRVARGVLNRYVEEPGNLYRVKKMVSFIGGGFKFQVQRVIDDAVV